MIAEGCRLYIITPETCDLRIFPDLLARALGAGDVAAVQLRLKNSGDDVWKRAIDALRPVARIAHDVILAVDNRRRYGTNDGQTDMPAREARRLMGPDLTLGVTCKSSFDLAQRAVEEGADYVAFGAFFPSTSKQVTNLADPEILRRWSQRKALPSCAIGGITAANLAPLVQAGANLLAIIGGVWNHAEGPAAGVRAINAAIKAAMDPVA